MKPMTASTIARPVALPKIRSFPYRRHFGSRNLVASRETFSEKDSLSFLFDFTDILFLLVGKENVRTGILLFVAAFRRDSLLAPNRTGAVFAPSIFRNRISYRARSQNPPWDGLRSAMR